MHELGWSASNNLCRLAEKIAPHFYTTYSFLRKFLSAGFRRDASAGIEASSCLAPSGVFSRASLFCKFTEYITSRDALPKGKVNVRYEFAADKPGEFISTECTWSA
jgi:hypothetical protein